MAAGRDAPPADESARRASAPRQIRFGKGAAMPRKRSEAEIRAEVRRLLEEIELLKEQHARRGLSFASLTEEELAQKIRGETSKSPFFYWQGWTAATTPGNAAYIEVGYRNPDPTFWQICVTMFFGLANFAADITATLAGRHTRWPYVSDAPTIVSAGGSGSAKFNYTTPMVERGTYLGNTVLWQPRTFDIGTYLDRSFFEVRLI
jgi:hypothetical protein